MKAAMNRKRRPRATEIAEKRLSTKQSNARPQRERVLIEFPAGLLQQTDQAARALNRNRSELIRSAVEHFLKEMEAKRFEECLAAAYAANSNMNLELSKEFEVVDREGL